MFAPRRFFLKVKVLKLFVRGFESIKGLCYYGIISLYVYTLQCAFIAESRKENTKH